MPTSHPATTPANCAVIGFGVGGHHARAYASHDSTRIAAIADLNADKRAAAAALYPTARIEADGSSLLADPDISVVSIASWDQYHHEQILAALSAGKHVFVEKPICQFPWQLEEIAAALRERPLQRLSVNLPLRTCPRFLALRNRIREGRLGQVYALDLDYIWGRPEKAMSGWRRDMPFYSLTQGAAIHMLDLLVWLLGDWPEVVVGMGARKAFGAAAMPYDDHVSALLRFKDGTIARVSAHSGARHPHFHHVRVYGTEASFTSDVEGARMILDFDENNPAVTPAEGDYPGRSEREASIHRFVDWTLGSGEPLASQQEALGIMRLAFAMDEAIASQNPVYFQPGP